MARSYAIEQISIEEVKDETLREEIRKNIIINKIQTVCLAFFGISFMIVAILSIFTRNREIRFIETTIGKLCGLVLAISIISYIVIHFLAGAIPKKTWRCPGCGQSLSYFVPSGTKASAGNRRTQILAERKGLRMGRVDKSFLIISEKCPYCEKRLLKEKE